MARVSASDRKAKREGLVTLKNWFQSQVGRMGQKNEIKDFSKYGPLNSFYYSARSEFGGDTALNTRSGWNTLFTAFLEGTKE